MSGLGSSDNSDAGLAGHDHEDPSGDEKGDLESERERSRSSSSSRKASKRKREKKR